MLFSFTNIWAGILQLILGYSAMFWGQFHEQLYVGSNNKIVLKKAFLIWHENVDEVDTSLTILLY